MAAVKEAAEGAFVDAIGIDAVDPRNIERAVGTAAAKKAAVAGGGDVAEGGWSAGSVDVVKS